MRTIPLMMLSLMALASVLLLAGCDAGEGSPEPMPTLAPAASGTPRITFLPERTPRPTPSPSPTPTPVDPVGHPPGTASGVPEVDALVAALQEHGRIPLEMWRFRAEPCVAVPVNDYGPPPVCPEGVTEGTPIDLAGSVGCHGGYTTPEHVDGIFNIARRSEDRLFGVARPSRPLDDRAEYAVVVSVAISDNNWGMTYEVGDGGVVSVNSGCGWTPELMWQRLGDREVILAPPRGDLYGYPPDTRFEGDAVFNAIADILWRGDAELLKPWVRWNDEGCVPWERDYLGPPAPCPAGAVEGTPVPSLATVGCHFSLRFPTESTGSYLPDLSRTDRLYGIQEVTDWFDVRADRVAVFQAKPPPGETEGRGYAMLLSDAGIVGFDHGCGETAVEMWGEYAMEGGTVLHPPLEVD